MSPGWWGSLSSVEHVYWIIAVAATTVLAIQLFIACVAGFEFDHPILGSSDFGHGDFGHHHGDDHHDVELPHFQLLTIRNVVAFLALFGWTGLAFNHMGLPLCLTLFLSFVCGFCMMILTAAIFYGLYKMQSSGNIDYNSAKGLKGTVYLRVPTAGIDQTGQIKVIIQGKVVDMEASNLGLGEIPTGASVLIKEVSNSKAFVERI